MARSGQWETHDPEGNPAILPASLWRGKILQNHSELASHVDDVLRAVQAPDVVHIDPTYAKRRRFYLRGAGPSRWLLVVVSYEQSPARIISAFGIRKDPRAPWSK